IQLSKLIDTKYAELYRRLEGKYSEYLNETDGHITDLRESIIVNSKGPALTLNGLQALRYIIADKIEHDKRISEHRLNDVKKDNAMNAELEKTYKPMSEKELKERYNTLLSMMDSPSIVKEYLGNYDYRHIEQLLKLKSINPDLDKILVQAFLQNIKASKAKAPAEIKDGALLATMNAKQLYQRLKYETPEDALDYEIAKLTYMDLMFLREYMVKEVKDKDELKTGRVFLALTQSYDKRTEHPFHDFFTMDLNTLNQEELKALKSVVQDELADKGKLEGYNSLEETLDLLVKRIDARIFFGKFDSLNEEKLNSLRDLVVDQQQGKTLSDESKTLWPGLNDLSAEGLKELKTVIEKEIQQAKQIADNGKKDEAMTVQQPMVKGGIDLNPDLLDLQIKRDGNGIPLPMTQQPSDLMKNIEGFIPVIINVVPVTNMPFLLGMVGDESDSNRITYDNHEYQSDEPKAKLDDVEQDQLSFLR
nr:hypothetical protein [Candidatus Omnitrophota bacterium]